MRAVLIAIIGTSVWAASANAQTPTNTDLPHVFDQPGAISVQPKVVYGTDDRRDVYQETDPTRLAQAAATCAIVSVGDLSNNGNGTFTLDFAAYRALGLPACASEPFASQPVAAFCSAFMVGDDIVATAGHCLNASNLAGNRLVFGFVMQDANTPVSVLPASQVYTPVEVLGRRLDNGYDYCIVRVDRAITAPGAAPLDIRRSGTIAAGTNVGVIGHPAGLPMKIAFGANTAVRSSGPDAYFVANTDTYGGNSGSPVFDALTGLVEGILVRGETDYASQGNCFVSYTVGNTAGRGEDVAKSTSFAQFIPEIIRNEGRISLSATSGRCGGTLTVTVKDDDLANAASATVTATAPSGDHEVLALAPVQGQSGEFSAVLPLASGTVQQGDGTLQASNGQTLTFTYVDADNGGGSASNRVATALLDCNAPALLTNDLAEIGSAQAQLQLATNEPCNVLVRYGTTCGNLQQQVSSATATTHLLNLNNLLPETTYFYSITLTDPAGNTTLLNDGGNCFAFTTIAPLDYFTQQFDDNAPALSRHRLTFTPTRDPAGYALCVEPADNFPTDPTGGTELALTEDGVESIVLTGGKKVSFFGLAYNEVLLCANGFLTFDSFDDAYVESLTRHFNVKRLSALFHDLSPQLQGTISYRQTADRLAITFQDVPAYTGNAPTLDDANSFQIELFFNGTLRLTYLDIATSDALVGLSRGLGLPTDFAPSPLLDYTPCSDTDADRDGLPDVWEQRVGLRTDSDTGDHGASGDPDADGLSNADELAEGTHPNRADSDFDGVNDAAELAAQTDPTGVGQPHHADVDANGRFSLPELLRVIQLYNLNGYHCEANTEDGYAPGPGNSTCLRHHSDYLNPAWDIDLSELLRLIQFYSARGYARDIYSEDSFALPQ